MAKWFGIWANNLRQKRGFALYKNALFYGALAGFSFAPFNATPVLWVCFPAFIFLLQAVETARQAFALGWVFSLGLLTVGLYWIAGAMFTDIAEFWWAVPLAVLGLPAFFALYYALGALFAFKWGIKSPHGIFMLGLAWFVADYARGHLFTGFPWDILGHAWGDFLPMLQTVSFLGIYGLTLVTCLCVVVPAILAPIDENKQPLPVKPALKWLAVGSVLVLLALSVWGQWRLWQAEILDFVPNVNLRLVQTALPQEMKWDKAARENNFKTLLSLSAMPTQKAVTHIIWPETATAFQLLRDEEKRHEIANILNFGMSLITGDVTSLQDKAGKISYYNSLLVIDNMGRVVGGYDKSHLVPFGEYMPYQNILPLPSPFAASFEAGAGPRTLRVAGLPLFSPLICYEAIFSGRVLDADDRPLFLLNVSNDAWYDHTTGPWQHFAVSRLRAIEEGMPLVRVANLGITAVVDSYGRMVSSVGWNKPGFVDSPLPNPLKKPPFFSRYNELLLWVLFLLCFSFITVLRYAAWRRKTGKN